MFVIFWGDDDFVFIDGENYFFEVVDFDGRVADSGVAKIEWFAGVVGGNACRKYFFGTIDDGRIVG